MDHFSFVVALLEEAFDGILRFLIQSLGLFQIQGFFAMDSWWLEVWLGVLNDSFCFISTCLLLAIEGVVAALECHQFVVAAGFHDRALMHHHDHVGIAHGGEAVGHEEHRASLQ